MTNEKIQIIEDVIAHAIGGMGLGSNDGKTDYYKNLLETFKKDHQITPQLIETYKASVDSFLVTEIQTITGYDEKDVIGLLNELK